jgi:hypothetical protein
MKTLRYVAGIFAASALVGVASAQLSSFTLNHGGWTYRETNLTGSPTGTDNGLADFVNPFGVDNMFQNWWWFGSPANGREFALSNQVSGTTTANSARLVYLEDAGPNAPDALLFDLEYTLTALPGGSTAVVQIGWKVHNLSNAEQTVRFFSYTDFDLNDTSGDDSGVFIAPNQFDLTDSNPLVRGGLVASNSGQAGWEQGFFSGLRDKLTDADLDALANATSPLGPGDLTNGFMWEFTLGPNGASNGSDQFVGSLIKYVNNPVPEPASIAVMTVALGALAARRRRRKLA